MSNELNLNIISFKLQCQLDLNKNIKVKSINRFKEIDKYDSLAIKIKV